MDILGKFSYFIMKCMLCVLYVSPHIGNSNDYTQHTIITKKIEKTSPTYIHLPPDLVL